MKYLYLCFVIVLLVFLQSCSSISKTDCKTGAWKEIGIRDASEGKELSTFDKYLKDCARYEVIPTLSEYKAGRHEGLKIYCNKSAFERSSTGKRAQTTAPCLNTDHQASYDSGYAKGQKLYCAQKKAFALGAEGSDYNLKICPIQKQEPLKTAYQSGLQVHCREENIFNFSISRHRHIPSIKNCPKELQLRARKAVVDASAYLNLIGSQKRERDYINAINLRISQKQSSPEQISSYYQKQKKHEYNIRELREQARRLKSRYDHY